MKPYRGIVRTDTWSDGLSTRTDVLSNLTSQYEGTHEAPRELFHGTVTLNPAQSRPYLSYTYGPGNF